MPVPPRPSSNDQAPPVYPEAAPARVESQTRRMVSNPHPLVEPEPEALAGTLSVQVTFDEDGNEVLEPPLPPAPRFLPAPAPPSGPLPTAALAPPSGERVHEGAVSGPIPRSAGE